MKNILLLTLITFFFTTNSFSTDFIFNGSIDSNWSNPGNWSPSYPGVNVPSDDSINIQSNCIINNLGNIHLEDGSILNISQNINLTIETSETLSITGIINNYGNIVNNGLMYIEYEIDLWGTSFVGLINNYGSINNYGELNTGELNNYQTGIINNYETISVLGWNSGLINNYRTLGVARFQNSGIINNYDEMEINMRTVLTLISYNPNIFSNDGEINVFNNSSLILNGEKPSSYIDIDGNLVLHPIDDINNGLISIEEFGVVQLIGDLVNNGVIITDGELNLLTVDSLFFGELITSELVNNSEIYGNGEIKIISFSSGDFGSLTNNVNASLNPGLYNNIGTLMATGVDNPGDLDLGEATYNCEINGTNESTDMLLVEGNVSLANAKLVVDWLTVPIANGTYTVMTFGGRNGIFSSVTIPPVAGFSFTVNYSDTNVTITATDITLSINENSNLDNIRIYPNPTDSNANIVLGQIYNTIELKLYNNLGQLIFNNFYNNTNQILLDIETDSGLYFIELLTNDNNRANLKVIKN